MDGGDEKWNGRRGRSTSCLGIFRAGLSSRWNLVRPQLMKLFHCIRTKRERWCRRPQEQTAQKMDAQ
jgi:hypothetical protein